MTHDPYKFPHPSTAGPAEKASLRGEDEASATDEVSLDQLDAALMLLAASELDGAEEARLRRRLSEDASLRSRYGQLKMGLSDLDTLMAAGVREDLARPVPRARRIAESAVRQWAAERVREPEQTVGGGVFRWAKYPLAAAAAVAAAAVVFVYVGNPSQTLPPVPSMVAADPYLQQEAAQYATLFEQSSFEGEGDVLVEVRLTELDDSLESLTLLRDQTSGGLTQLLDELDATEGL